MRNQVENGIAAIQDIHLLIFNIMGIRLGVDMEQVYQMKSPEQVDEEEFQAADFHYFHEMVPFHQESVYYHTPRVLFLRHAECLTGVLIDQPEDIVRVPIDSIQPLPPSLGKGRKSEAIWGVALRDGDIVLLVDFDRTDRVA